LADLGAKTFVLLFLADDVPQALLWSGDFANQQYPPTFTEADHSPNFVLRVEEEGLTSAQVLPTLENRCYVPLRKPDDAVGGDRRPGPSRG
jgi:hypothetical protein